MKRKYLAIGIGLVVLLVSLGATIYEPEQVSEVKYFNVSSEKAGVVELIPASSDVRFKILEITVVPGSTTVNNVCFVSSGTAVWFSPTYPQPFDMDGGSGLIGIRRNSEKIGVFQTPKYNRSLTAQQSAAQRMNYSGSYVEIRNSTTP